MYSQIVSERNALTRLIRALLAQQGYVLFAQPDSDVHHRLVREGRAWRLITSNRAGLLDNTVHPDLMTVLREIAGSEPVVSSSARCA